jgi:hypothetical protein
MMMMMMMMIIIIIIIINWYLHIPKSVTEHEYITVLWNQGVQMGRKFLANRPHIINKNKKGRICVLIHVKISSDRNVMPKEAQKKLKYKNLGIGIQRVWNRKCFVIPVIIGAHGILSKIYKIIWKKYQDNTQ